jgi:glycogen operon protein
VARFIIDCLEYWVREMHVDGFRFDLASAMARGEDGEPMHNPPVLWGIELSDFLSGTKIIAEAWDAAGLYQVGTFPGYRWSEWNGRYRDCMRRFVRGDPDLVGEVATRISGSSDLYQANLRLPINSVNFITCHDGFTLWDLASYKKKHNRANQEQNRDGTDHSFSWNCGVEGESDDPEIVELRRCQAKNFIAILLLSQGIPMLLAGDEIRRSQRGNNNTWCQDNELGWIDWSALEPNRDMLRFVRQMIALRKRHPSLQRRHFFSGTQREGARFDDIRWHGKALGAPPWKDPKARILAFTVGETSSDRVPLHVMLNMSTESHNFELPALDDISWHRAVDTALTSPRDIAPPEEQAGITDSHYWVAPRSVVVLEGF